MGASNVATFDDWRVKLEVRDLQDDLGPVLPAWDQVTWPSNFWENLQRPDNCCPSEGSVDWDPIAFDQTIIFKSTSWSFCRAPRFPLSHDILRVCFRDVVERTFQELVQSKFLGKAFTWCLPKKTRYHRSFQRIVFSLSLYHQDCNFE